MDSQDGAAPHTATIGELKDLISDHIQRVDADLSVEESQKNGNFPESQVGTWSILSIKYENKLMYLFLKSIGAEKYVNRSLCDKSTKSGTNDRYHV